LVLKPLGFVVFRICFRENKSLHQTLSDQTTLIISGKYPMSGNYQIIYWRDIPSQIKGKVGRKRVSRPLSDRFIQIIDAAAMASGDTDTDQYLAEWKPSESMPIVGDTDEFLDGLVAKIEADYPAKRLSELAKNGGFEPKAD
jgi:hypothetical protein